MLTVFLGGLFLGVTIGVALMCLFVIASERQK